MELFLNLAWALLAVAAALLWLRYGSREGVDHRSQAVALAVLLLVLFPVISVSDDLLSLQNPAEVDCCQRRDDVVASAPFIQPAVADVLQPLIAGQPNAVVQSVDHGNIVVLAENHPALAAIENRPPPVA